MIIYFFFFSEENLPELEDTYLIAVLRCCKYNIKKSEVKLKKFLNVRRTIIKNLKKLDNEKIEPLISDGFSECLPWADKHGRPIYVFRPSNTIKNILLLSLTLLLFKLLSLLFLINFRLIC